MILATQSHKRTKLTSSAGFSLIELVIGILVMSVALAYFTNMLTNSNKFVADPWHQVRASELASALLSEINAKSFDENSDRNGGLIRCSSSDTGAVNCTSPANLGSDSESSRDDYDDVDDYHGLTQSGADIIEIVTSGNQSLSASYANYQLSVTVFYDANFDGVDDAAIGAHKLIRVTVTDPLNNQIQFASYRSNY